jgi:Tfp pilus assembly protein PilN
MNSDYLNLLPPESKKLVRERSLLLLVKSTLFITISITVVTALIILGYYYYLVIKQTTTKNDIADLQSQVDDLRPYNEAVIELNKKLSYIKTNSGTGVLWSSRLYQLSELIPPGVKTDSLIISDSGGSFNLSGQANTRKDLLRLKDNLEQVSYLKDIKLPITSLSQQTDITFQITALISKDET